MAGPGLAGVVIQASTAPVAIAVDAVSFLASALIVSLIGTREPAPTDGDGQPIGSAPGEGITYIWRHSLLPAFACTNAALVFCIGMTQAVLLLLLTRNLHLTPGVIGLIFGTGSVGGLLGTAAAARVSRWLGLGPAIIGASFLRGLGLACVPLAALLPVEAAPVVVGATHAVHQFGWSLWSVTQLSVRQSLVPNRLRGRVTASFLSLVRGAAPVGASVGGMLGEYAGVVPTFTGAGVGLLLSTGWLVLPSLWDLREQPKPAEHTSRA